MNRRTFLGTVPLGLMSACTTEPGSRPVLPTDPRVREVEAARRGSGRIHPVTLTASPGRVDLGGPVVDTWTYDGTLPGREIRVRAGDLIEATLVNRLPTDTTIHWHGLALRNDMDGTLGLTQSPVTPGQSFTYRFIAETPGTYWFHPHTGVQLDRGLYAPLIVEDPAEPGGNDAEWTIVLDDWLDGTGTTPDEVFARLGSGGHMMSAEAVPYPYHLVNGRIPAAPTTFTGKPGQRVRIRFLNAGADTVYRVGLGGHRMTVTHTDGLPVTPVDTGALRIAMGERYDVLVTLGDGVFPLTAQAEGRSGAGFAVVRTATGEAPRPEAPNGTVIGYPDLTATAAATLPARRPDATHRLTLTGGMMGNTWGIDGRPRIREGQRIRLEFRNSTTMWHPVHLHGHTFQLGPAGARKDTALVRPGQTVACDLDADNPGQWMIHCHNAYHAEAGMMTTLGYET